MGDIRYSSLVPTFVPASAYCRTVESERMTEVFLAAQLELREAMQRGATDLSAGVAAWDAAVNAVNRLTAVLAHAQHAELDAARALAALAGWTLAQQTLPIPAQRNDAETASVHHPVEQA